MDFFVVVSGAVDIIDTSGDKDRLIVIHGPGAINGNIHAFAGRPAMTAGRAVQLTEVIRRNLEETRLLLVRSASLGEKFVAALLRRFESAESVPSTLSAREILRGRPRCTFRNSVIKLVWSSAVTI
jgi:CRP-like cAMP-binding protein